MPNILGNPAVKLVAAIVAVIVTALVIYIGAVVGLYALALIVEIIGRIF